MKTFSRILVAAGCIAIYSCEEKVDYTQYVDPFIGTDATHFVSEWRSEACTYPGAVAPHGMVQISPETNAPGDYLRGYYYSQDTIRRFSLVEHFSGWPDGSAGKGLIMPFSVQDTTGMTLRDARSSFDHAQEEAGPGYYSVYLKDSRISCTFASTVRAAIAQFSFQNPGTPGLIMGGFSSFEQIDGHTVQAQIGAGSGYIGQSDIAVHLHIEFDTPLAVRSKNKTYVVTFPERRDRSAVTARIGVSYTSAANAQSNLRGEISGWNLQKVRRLSQELWNDVLSRVEVEEGAHEDKIMFYTALYHGSLLPVNATDLNREYPGHEVGGPLGHDETHYIYYTPWDAFRTLYPMINFLYPGKGLDYVRSSLRIYKVSGRLPEPEVMTSVHMSVLFADAIARGIDDFDIELAFNGLRELILDPPYFRPDMALYDSLGFVPYPHRYATTATLEFAFNDWAFSRLANKLGKNSLSEKLRDRSLNYRNNYNPHTRFMESRNYDGSWADASLYAEANKWNMSWFVPHDNRGLINLMGGDQAFCEHLERNFAEQHFVLDNECPMNFPFLFSYAGKPWKTMEWKNRTLRYYFNTSPGGIPGNDDWGTMSSWYAWGALGLFPVCPGTDELIISGPVFQKVTIHHPEAGDIVIEAEHASPDNMYVQGCRLGGKKHDQVFVRQSDLMKAGGIRFEMGAEPNKSWGADGMPPYSVTKDRSDYEVVSLGLRKQTVLSDEPFNLHVDIRNAGALGSYPLTLKLDDEILHTDFPLMPRHSRRLVSIPLQLYKGGHFVLSAGEKSIDIEVLPTRLPPQRALLFTAPDIPALVRKGDSLHYRCDVKNISGYPSSLGPVLYRNGVQVKILPTVKVDPGQTQEIAGIIPVPEATGFYKLSIQDSPSVLFKVFQKPRETLVLHYTFDDVRGNTVPDHSGFQKHGDIVGTLDYVPGIEGRGIMVQHGHVKVPPSKSLAIEDETLTMLCWYKPADEDGKASLVTKGAHNMMKLNGVWQLQLAIGGWGVGQCSYNAPNNPETNGPAWQGRWTHFAGTRANDTLHIFYNGAHASQLAVEGTIGHTPFPWCVGTNAEIPIGRTPDGVIDEVMIFAGALDEQAISGIYQTYRKAEE